jgi:hypothetical protein
MFQKPYLLPPVLSFWNADKTLVFCADDPFNASVFNPASGEEEERRKRGGREEEERRKRRGRGEEEERRKKSRGVSV